MRTLCVFILAMLLSAVVYAFPAQAQEPPGFAFGAFYDSSVPLKFKGDKMTLIDYGFRLMFRDGRFVEAYADVGNCQATHQILNTDTAPYYGIGVVFWALRDEDMVTPIDLGVEGSFHFSTLKNTPDSQPQGGDLKITRTTGQLVLRAHSVMAAPYVKAGWSRIKLDDMDDTLNVANPSELEQTVPAINVGVQFGTPSVRIGVEANYAEDMGAGVHMEFRF